MSGSTIKETAFVRLLVRHGKIALLGLAVVLVPLAIASNSVQHVQKLLSSAVKKISPGVEVIGGVGITTVLVLSIAVACWLIGHLVNRTVLGQQLLSWEKAKFSKPKLLKHSPLLQERAKKSKEAAKDAPPPVQPALACVAGVWQPGAIVEEATGGWTTVFVPEVPALTTGRLYCLRDEQVLRLEVPLPEFRERLASSGQGSGDWLKARSEVESAGETGGSA